MFDLPKTFFCISDYCNMSVSLFLQIFFASFTSSEWRVDVFQLH